MSTSDYTTKDIKRFWSKVDKLSDKNGCWLWTGTTTKKGYGKTYFAKRSGQLAHRIAYMLIYEEIPKGMYTPHICNNLSCVNPDHLLVQTVQERFWSFVQITKDTNQCWEWQSTLANGYGVFSYKNVNHYAHRYSWQIINGTIPDGLFICHHCDNPSCVNPNHLFLGTHQDNMKDRDNKGRVASHERHWKSKVTKGQVKQIRQKYSSGNYSQLELAIEYGLSKSQIGKIINYRSWY